MQIFQAANAGCIPNITDKEQWPHVDKGFQLLPPVGKPRGLGMQKKNRFLGPLERSGKATRQSKRQGCGELGHRKGSWRCSLTGTQKRKRKSKKAGVKSGRKKSKETQVTETSVAEPPKLNTPRTRAAAAREAAMAAALQTEEQSLTRRRLSLESEAAAQDGNQSTTEAATQVEEPELPSKLAKKMTPIKKRVCTKVRKTPTKKG
ncbi:hypothetical protein BS78_10G268700 [Paspalum vaginatum]|nr:hypothetical protein BS78_10G268700 [Paspalum vaginatum]